MISYKVWIAVERYDDQKDEYIDIDLDFSSTAYFEGHGAKQRAIKAARLAHEVVEVEQKL